MSIAIMSRLFKVSLGGPSRKMLAVRLADFADDDGRGIYPGIERLSRETELSERTVQRLLKDFVDEGLLVIVRHASGRPGLATCYDMDLDALERIAARHATGDTMSPVKRGDMDAETGDISDVDGCHHVTQTVIEPPIEPLIGERARERA
jgi:hypothetical protein